MQRANITITFTLDGSGAGEIDDATEDFRGIIEAHFTLRKYGTQIQGLVRIQKEFVDA